MEVLKQCDLCGSPAREGDYGQSWWICTNIQCSKSDLYWTDKVYRNNNNYSVWKYTLKASQKQVIEIPHGGEFLSVEYQGEDIVVYALVKVTEESKDSYEFRVYGTGHLIDVTISDYRFLGTTKMYNGNLMFHVFYKWV